jgi:tRNA threonylcarbamoyladenosine biosynthesis protein TsaB
MSSEPVILSLETATLGGSVYLGRGNAELSSRLGNPAVSHSNSLISDIAAVLAEAALTLKDVTVLACASGPGSFTGLRIGIATLKALSATLKIPCIGIPTLEAVAHAAGPSAATVALLPAGRGELFSQLFAVSSAGEVTAVDRASHLSPARFLEKYGALTGVMWTGHGAHVQRELLEQHARERGLSFGGHANGAEPPQSSWRLAPEVANLARHVALLSLGRLSTGSIDTPQTLAAIYVRPSDAELNQTCR